MHPLPRNANSLATPLLLAGLLASLAQLAAAQEVVTLTWPTKHAAKPAALPKPASDFLPAFRVALRLLTESNIVALALSQPAFLGFDGQAAQRLQSLCAKRYQVIDADPVFSRASSLLPYCYSDHTPTNGRALMYVPKHLDTNTPAIVFLHGYGGSFRWTDQLLAEAFPHHVILYPAYGISAATVPSTYVSECISAAATKLGHSVTRPILMGLSAGGFGAVRVYTQTPERFSQLVVLAAYPPPDSMSRFTSSMKACFIVGGCESYVQSGEFHRSMQSIRSRVGFLAQHVMPDANHYFLLEKQDETIHVMKSSVSDKESRTPER